MNAEGNLWVVAYEEAAQAEAARAAILSMQSKHLLIVPDVVLVAW
jgi:uncharacterized membrane protein